MLMDLTVKQFVAEVGSHAPAPGGGSVAALAGALAAGLIAMYCSLSLDREKYPGVAGLMEETAQRARSAGAELAELVQRDTEAFQKVMDAYRLPRGDDGAKEKRRRAIQEAILEAARVPLQTARACFRLLEMTETVALKGNPGAVTDLAVGNLQAYAGLQGAVYNVKINLGSLKDDALRQELVDEVGAVLERGKALFLSNKEKLEKEI